MFEKLPIKKEYVLIAATLILLVASYRFAFKNTIEAWQMHHSLITKLDQSADLSYQPQYLERKLNNLNKTIGLYMADTTELRNNIISTIASVAEKQNVKLTEVPVQDVSYSNEKYGIEKLGFEGDYTSLLKLANALQSTAKIGLIRSETFKSVEVRTSTDKTKKLILELYLEITK